VSVLSREVKLTQNAALGAIVQWRFTCGYNESHPNRSFAPLPLVFVVLPTILHQETRELVAGTRKASGIRAFVAKFSEFATSKQDVLMGLHSRVDQWRSLSLESVRMALTTRLVQLNLDGTLVPLTLTPPHGSVPRSVRPLLAESEKFGFWCGQVSFHEISTLLRIRF
jgi:hypothetical protein